LGSPRLHGECYTARRAIKMREVPIMNGTSLSPFYFRRWIYGIPAPIWLKNIDMISEFISKNKLKPVQPESLPNIQGMQEVANTAQAKSALIVDRRPYPGGIRIAHLHFKGEIYLVKEELWREFSGRIVKDFQAKLASVKSVGFEDVMELSEAVDKLG
jgi:hypothetical protein